MTALFVGFLIGGFTGFGIMALISLGKNHEDIM